MTDRPGILAYGTYVPQFRLDRSAIAEALRAGGGRGTRSVAGHDEDATTLGVAAARRAMAALQAGAGSLGSVWFATTAAPYVEKTNATAVHAAVGAPVEAGAFDVNGAARSSVGALRAAFGQVEPALVVLADIRTGLPGSADERDAGDAAAAFVVGTGAVVAELVGLGSRSVELLERWREPTSTTARTWEDRFGEQALVPLAVAALDDALAAAGLTLADVDHLVVAGTHDRAARTLRKQLGAGGPAVVADRSATIGNPGAAQVGLLLADALDVADAGQTIAVVTVGDGADALVLRATDALGSQRATQPSTDGVTVPVAYPTFLQWRGQLQRELPRRPDPDVPVAPATFRERTWKFSFRGSRCTSCGTVHLPPQRVCGACGAVDAMEPADVAGAPGTVVTVTADNLAYSEDPPLAVAIIDFEGGGRVQAELTDHAGELPAIGDRVEMTLRRAYTVNGIHNYVWKARPVREAPHG